MTLIDNFITQKIWLWSWIIEILSPEFQLMEIEQLAIIKKFFVSPLNFIITVHMNEILMEYHVISISFLIILKDIFKML